MMHTLTLFINPFITYLDRHSVAFPKQFNSPIKRPSPPSPRLTRPPKTSNASAPHRETSQEPIPVSTLVLPFELTPNSSSILPLLFFFSVYSKSIAFTHSISLLSSFYLFNTSNNTIQVLRVTGSPLPPHTHTHTSHTLHNRIFKLNQNKNGPIRLVQENRRHRRGRRRPQRPALPLHHPRRRPRRPDRPVRPPVVHPLGHL
ncbi:hypothetical protein H0G86_010952 [Trichoderma simmonsii]|uniref:Uncharacterized protein n=1 Tax=Trichoderma simmonsii TaxID=1491479 RepID=A0A8G0PKK1_9HYPO|nr:hypothetical protein H0G86_010952 [Trichoderma simmonsii]